MSIDAINSTTSANNSATPDSSRIPVKTLNQNDFLKLLITQLSQQDPLNPKQDTEFIAQMTQFSALEQSKSMQSDIAKMRTEQQFVQANSLIGRTVELKSDQETPIRGVVSAVKVEAGTPKLVVNGESYAMSDLLTVAPNSVQLSTKK